MGHVACLFLCLVDWKLFGVYLLVVCCCYDVFVCLCVVSLLLFDLSVCLFVGWFA